MRQRMTLAACGAAALSFCLTSCSPVETTACALAWVSNSVYIHVEGDTEVVADVGYCDGSSSCVPQRFSVINDGSTATPLPAQHEGNEWTVSTGDAPRHGRVAAYDHDGNTLTERAVQLTWENKGTTRCPGPYSTHITLHVPNDR